MDYSKLFGEFKKPMGTERSGYISAGDSGHEDFIPKPGQDIPIMRVYGGVSSAELTKAKDGRLFITLKGGFWALPLPGGPEFEPKASGKFIPPDCVAGEIGYAGAHVDMIIIKRHTAKSPGKFTFVVVYSPEMESKLQMLGEVHASLELPAEKPVKQIEAPKTGRPHASAVK